MTQTYADLTTPESGTQLVADYNAAKTSLLSMHAGTSRPSYAVAGTLWRDTDTPSATIQTVYMYDGTDDIPWGRFDVTTNVFTPYMGAAGFPTAAFLTLADDATVSAMLDTLGGASATGTGGVVRAASPTLTGTLVAAAATFSGAVNLSNADFEIKGQRIQGWTLTLANPAGTLRHNFSNSDGSGLGNFTTQITAASFTAQNTPTGTDSSTAFVTGVKISSANTNHAVLDTAAQVVSDFLGIAASGDDAALLTTPTLSVTVASRNVNGTTRNRPEIQAYGTAGAAWAINTTNIPSGKYINANYLGFMT